MVQFVYSLQDVSPELGHARLVRVSTLFHHGFMATAKLARYSKIRKTCKSHVRVM